MYGNPRIYMYIWSMFHSCVKQVGFVSMTAAVIFQLETNDPRPRAVQNLHRNIPVG